MGEDWNASSRRRRDYRQSKDPEAQRHHKSKKKIDKPFIVEYTLKEGEKSFFDWQGEPGVWSKWSTYARLKDAEQAVKKLNQANSSWRRYRFRLKPEEK